MKSRTDNWASTLSALGSVKDKSVGQEFRARRRLHRTELETLVDQHAICSRVVFKIVQEAFRTPWRFEDSEHEPLRLRLEREIKISERLAKAAGWARLYGACGLALPIIDGRQPDQPVDWSGIRGMGAPSPVPAHQFEPYTYDSAFGSPSYREVLTYRVETLSESRPVIDVHASRMLVFEPLQLPIESRIENASGYNGTAWGPSVLQQIYDEILREGASRAHANSMMYAAAAMVIKLSGLKDKITMQDGIAVVRAELNAIRESWDSTGILGLDTQDEAHSVQSTFPGAPELIRTQRDALAAALPMPREIGLNESETGLRGGELSGAQALWYGTVDAYRRNTIEPVLRHLIQICAKAWDVQLGEFGISWDPLWVPSEKEISENSARNAQTDRTYFEINALGAKEIRRARFVEHERGEIAVAEDDENELRKAAPYIGPALEIVQAVAEGKIPRDAGAQMLLAAGYPVILLGTAGQTEPLQTTIAKAEQGGE